MRVLHVPYCFYPDPVGGTEIYVAALARHLREDGAEVSIAAPGQVETSYDWQRIPVDRFRVSPEQDLDIIYGDGDPVASAGFARLLSRREPDIVHLHARSPAVSLRLVREAKRRDIPVVFTYHSPTVTCARGTLLLMGRTPCDGMLSVSRCATCMLNARGVPGAAAAALARLPRRTASRAAALAPHHVETVLRLPGLIADLHDAYRGMMTEVDHIVTVSAWSAEVVRRNGVPAAKVTLCRNGLAHDAPPHDAPPHDALLPCERPLRLAYLGRIDPAKGLDVLLEAIRFVPAAPIRLDVFPVVQSGVSKGYVSQLSSLAGKDNRVSWNAPISGGVVEALRHYDMLAVPSIGLESGPLVIYEAFAAGIPVIGSNLGGIAEIVRDGVDGILAPPGQPESWAAALDRLASDRQYVKRLRRGVSPPRRMKDVAVEMQRIYAGLTANATIAAASGTTSP